VPIYLNALTEEPAEEAVQKAISATAAEFKAEKSPETQQRKQPPIPIAELPPKGKPAASVEEYERLKPAEKNKQESE